MASNGQGPLTFCSTMGMVRPRYSTRLSVYTSSAGVVSSIQIGLCESQSSRHTKVSSPGRAVDAVQRCGVGCVRPDHQGLEKQHDVQAACEPGGGGCGGVPDHPARLHTHRTSPVQALLTIFG
jgi:hypothetical protein